MIVVMQGWPNAEAIAAACSERQAVGAAKKIEVLFIPSLLPTPQSMSWMELF